MKRSKAMLLTTIILSISMTTVFTFDFKNTDASLDSNSFELSVLNAEAAPSGVDHTIEMEAVQMPDGMYAYRMVSYDRDGVDLVGTGVYDTDPQIPGPTLVFTEGDSVQVTLTNNACADNFILGGVGSFENSQVGIHVHGVHYDISDDATYARMNMDMSGDASAATCGSDVVYNWDVGLGTHGTWPYHDHTFSQNEVGAEDVGLFGTVIVNPHNGKIDGIVDAGEGNIKKVDVDEIEKEFVLWMVSSEVLGRSVFYGMEIDNAHPTTPGKQTALWVNPPLYASDGAKVRYHVLGIGDETHAFHLHGHRWVDTTGGAADIIDVKEITPLQRHTFLVEVSDNGNDHDGTEGWMYHCHVFDHMQAGMSGMMMAVDGDDTLPDVGAVFTISDEPGLWFKTLNAGIADDLDEVLESIDAIPDGTARAGTGFPLDYLGTAFGSGFDDSLGRSLAVISPGETVLFNMKDSQTKHTVTALIYPEDAQPETGNVGGNGLLSQLDLGLFDTQLGIRGSSFLTDGDGKALALNEEGLYVFVCKIHPYMFSAVIVDDPTTNVSSSVLGASLPLLDFSNSLIVMTRTGSLDNSVFPTVIPPTDALALELLKDFFVITDPSNWKDYEKSTHTVNVAPVLITTNSEDLVVALHATETDTLTLAGNLGISKPGGDPPAAVTGLALDSDMPIGAITEPTTPGIGEVWVNTQYERTVNKNFHGTPNDKPGTITVIDAANDWNIKQKISLPEINMNHPHNMWTDSKNEVIYQTQWFDTRMVVIDRESGEMIKDNFVGQSPSHVMTAPDTGKIYIAMNGEEQVTELDPITYETTKQISTGSKSHPHGHWISSDGQYMVTPDFISLTSTVIDLNDYTSEKAVYANDADLIEKAVYPGNALMTAVTAPGQSVLLAPIATGMMGSGEKYYTADFLGNTISVIDLDTKEIIKQIDLLGVGAGLPIQTPVSPDDKWVVTAHVLGPKITVIDTSSDTIVATLDCDPGCHGVQWGAKDGGDGYYAYVSNKFSNALLVVDPDPDGDGDGSNAEISGTIVLNEQFATEIDDPVIGYDGMGGQGILTIPNVYDGWIDATVAECGTTADPCSEELVTYLNALSNSQREAVP